MPLTLSCFCIFRPKWEPTCNGAGLSLGAFPPTIYFPLNIYQSSNGFNNFFKICIRILHVSKQFFLSISEWLSNLPNDCDQYIQAFTLPTFPLWCLLPVCSTQVNVAVWPKLKFFCGSSIIEYLEVELDARVYISKCSLKSFCQIWKKTSMTALIRVRIFLQGFQMLNKPVLTTHTPCQE